MSTYQNRGIVGTTVQFVDTLTCDGDHWLQRPTTNVVSHASVDNSVACEALPGLGIALRHRAWPQRRCGCTRQHQAAHVHINTNGSHHV